MDAITKKCTEALCSIRVQRLIEINSMEGERRRLFIAAHRLVDYLLFTGELKSAPEQLRRIADIIDRERERLAVREKRMGIECPVDLGYNMENQ